MVTELQLGSIQAYGTLSGYIYLHLPQYLCKQFAISPSTSFSVTYKDGKIVIEQIKEDKENAA
ncbi:hypothetical protein ES703_120008 [subsurface metagenome]